MTAANFGELTYLPTGCQLFLVGRKKAYLANSGIRGFQRIKSIEEVLLNLMSMWRNLNARQRALSVSGCANNIDL